MMKKMMENKLSYIRLVILLLVFSLTVGLLSACNQKQGNNTSSGGSSSDVISSDEQSSSNRMQAMTVPARSTMMKAMTVQRGVR